MFERKMFSNLLRFSRRTMLLIPVSVIAIVASSVSSMLSTPLRDTAIPLAVALDLVVSILALITVLMANVRFLFSGAAAYYADEDEPTKPARVNGSALWGRKSIPDQLPLPAKWSRLSLSGDNTLEDLRTAFSRAEERILERNLDPALEKILIKLAMALEPHIKAGYRVTSIEVRISPPQRDTRDTGDNFTTGRNVEEIPITPKSK